MVDTIRVHVTPAQREYLEFLVNRRINDIRMERVKSNRDLYEQIAELDELQAIKKELQHAGT